MLFSQMILLWLFLSYFPSSPPLFVCIFYTFPFRFYLIFFILIDLFHGSQIPIGHPQPYDVSFDSFDITAEKQTFPFLIKKNGRTAQLCVHSKRN